MDNRIYEFEIPSHVTHQRWLVYIIKAKKGNDSSFYYVGKVGDNRDGCNPIISRIGNHFSFNKIHSQVRNKLNAEIGNSDYNIFYATFGDYKVETRSHDLERINELERKLNKLLQETGVNVLNPYYGRGYLTKAEQAKRKNVVSDQDMTVLNELVAKAIG